jgi:uncharacterized protein YqeY
MSVYQQISDDVKAAMKAGEAFRRDTLRLVQSAMKNEAINAIVAVTDLSDDVAMAVLKRLAKQRKDSIESFTAGGRPELADKEKQELSLIETYLPAALSEEAIEKAIKELLAEAQVAKADMGKFMGTVMKKLGSAADGTTVKKVLERLLS